MQAYQKYVMYFSFFMAFFYSLSGFVILFSNKFNVEWLYRILFCIMLVGYGIFRFYRAYQIFKKNKETHDE